VKALAAVAVAVAAGGAAMAAGYAVAGRDGAEPPAALGPGTVTVVVDIEHSRFMPSSLRVEAGTRVRFVVVNGDPINHELIVGPRSVHDRHRNGTEATHPPKPGELSLGPDGQGVTIYRFDDPGTVEMACHLPGHYDFGMHGEIEVVASET
jgi:uncharacterized cupredoxin-like copper-binding protein